jgi:hypothetical protein
VCGSPTTTFSPVAVVTDLTQSRPCSSQRAAEKVVARLTPAIPERTVNSLFHPFLWSATKPLDNEGLSCVLGQRAVRAAPNSSSDIDSVESVLVWDEGCAVGSLRPNHMKEVELSPAPKPCAF